MGSLEYCCSLTEGFIGTPISLLRFTQKCQGAPFPPIRHNSSLLQRPPLVLLPFRGKIFHPHPYAPVFSNTNYYAWKMDVVCFAEPPFFDLGKGQGWSPLPPLGGGPPCPRPEEPDAENGETEAPVLLFFSLSRVLLPPLLPLLLSVPHAFRFGRPSPRRDALAARISRVTLSGLRVPAGKQSYYED